MADQRTVVVVDDQTDSLAGDVVRELTGGRRVPVMHIPAARLGLVELRFERDRVYVDGARLRAVFFRAGPWSRFDEGFQADDAAFASMEVAAAWLAVVHVPSVVALNRPDPQVWTARSEWPIWRRRMVAAGVPCIDLEVGAVDGDFTHWLPWGGGFADPPGPASRRSFATALTTATHFSSAVWFDGRAIRDADGRGDGRIASVLREHGIELAGVTMDAAGRVASCTARPEVDDDMARDLAPLIAARLSAAFEAG